MTKTRTVGQQIKAEIKAAGIPVKQISVKTSYPGYEEVVTVEVKDTAINLEEVKAIANKYRHVDYDERCQEILQGGNTFIRVRYSYEAEDKAIKALEPWADDWIRQIKHLMKVHGWANYRIEANNGAIVNVCADDKGYMLYTGDTYTVSKPHRFINPSDYRPEYFAHAFARALFELGARFLDLIPNPEY